MAKDKTLSLSQEELDALIAERVEQAATEAAAKAKREAEIASLTPAQIAEIQRDEETKRLAVIYGDRILQGWFDCPYGNDSANPEEMGTTRITADALKQFCYMAIRDAANGYHWARDGARNTRHRLHKLQQEAGSQGNRHWAVPSYIENPDPRTNGSDPRQVGDHTRTDEPVTEFESSELKMERTYAFFNTRKDQMFIMGFTWEYISAMCDYEMQRHDDELRAEGQSVPVREPRPLVFDVSDRKFDAWKIDKNERYQDRMAKQRAESDAAADLEDRTRPLGTSGSTQYPVGASATDVSNQPQPDKEMLFTASGRDTKRT